MKLYVWTECERWSNEDNNYAQDNPIEIDWDFPHLPRRGDSFYFYDFTHKKHPFDDGGLIYEVVRIDWSVKYNKTRAVLYIHGT